MTTSAPGPISPVTRKPSAPLDTPAINAAPIELDGEAITQPQPVAHTLTEEEGEKRKELIKEREGDMGVIVDVPKGITADEIKAAGEWREYKEGEMRKGERRN